MLTLLVTTRAPSAQATLDSFFRAMDRGEPGLAWSEFAPRTQAVNPIASLADWLSSPQAAIVKGYEHTTVQTFRVGIQVKRHSALPYGVVAKLRGTIIYTDSDYGMFTALFELHQGAWRLFSLEDVEITAERAVRYSQSDRIAVPCPSLSLNCGEVKTQPA